MSVLLTIAFLVSLTIPEGISSGDQGMNMRCLCITKEKKPIGRLIAKMEVTPANSHCEEIEIIATLKKDGKKVCLDPDAPWIKKVLEKKLTQQKNKP